MPDGLTTGHSVDLFAPAHSPPAHADLTVHVTASPLAPFWQRPTDSRTPVLCSSRRRDKYEKPAGIQPTGILFWRRPTLARPIAVLPTGLQRFTAVFGMGTGGATALLSPEIRAGLAVSARRADADLWRRRRSYDRQ